jgi:hypothetical protein
MALSFEKVAEWRLEMIWTFGEDENLLPLPGIEIQTLICLSRSLVIILNELPCSQLHVVI